jgi:hypothetical protein
MYVFLLLFGFCDNILNRIQKARKAVRKILRNEIKSILARKDLNCADYANTIQVEPQSLSRKLKTEVFTFKELAGLANLTSTSLCLVDKDTKEIVAILEPSITLTPEGGGL